MPDAPVQVFKNVQAPEWRDATQGKEGGANPSKPRPSRDDSTLISAHPGTGSHWKDGTPGGALPVEVVLNQKEQGPLLRATEPDETDRLPVPDGFVECNECGAPFQAEKLPGQDITRLEAHKQAVHRPGGARDTQRMLLASQTPEAKKKRSAGMKRYWDEIRAGKRPHPRSKKKKKK